MPTLLTISQIAKRRGVPAQNVANYQKKPWFPQPVKGRLYDADDVERALAKNVRMTKRGVAPKPATKPEAKPATKPEAKVETSPARAPVTPESLSLARSDDPFIIEMMSGKASPLTIARGAVQMASRMLAMAAMNSTAGKNELDGLKNTLQELRGSEAAWMEIEVSKRNMLERSEVEQIVTALVMRLVRSCDILENSIGTEFALWLADPAMQAMQQDDRSRKVREFVAKTCREVRQALADGYEKLLAPQPDQED